MMHCQKSINKVSSLQPSVEGLERKLEGKYVGGLVSLLKEIESTNREIEAFQRCCQSAMLDSLRRSDLGLT